MAQFPIYTRKVSLSGTVRVTVHGVTTDIDFSTSSAVWGFASSTASADNAEAGSLARHIADKLLTHAQVTNVKAHYEVDEANNHVQMRFSLATPTSPVIAGITDIGPASPLDLNQLGFADGATAVSDSSNDVILRSGARNFAGIWTPNKELSGYKRHRAHIFDDAESATVQGAMDTHYHGSREHVSFLHEAVEIADVFAFRASDSGFAAMAGRNVADDQNLLETMFEGFVKGEDMRVYLGHGDYVSVQKMSGGALTSAMDLLVESPDDPRRPTVSWAMKIIEEA